MGDTEDFDNDEEIVEDRRKRQPFLLLSFLRHIFACSGVVFLPFCGSVIDFTVADDVVNFDYVFYYYSGEVIGIVGGGIYLLFYGRRPAIVVLNLSYLVFIFVSNFNVTKKGDKDANPNVLHSMSGAIMNQFSQMIFIFYIAEMCSVTFRGFFMALYESSYYLAHFSYSVGNRLDLSPVYLVCTMVSVLSTVLSFSTAETPYFLAMKGDFENAEDTFSWIRTGRVDTVEYDQMLDQAQKKMSLKAIFSSTFASCMIICVLLVVCNFDGFELLQEVYYHKMSLKEDDWNKPEYVIVFSDDWMFHSGYMCLASFLSAWASLVIRRKTLYGMGYALTLLMLVPLLLASSPFEMMSILAIPSFMIKAALRDPITMIIPLEILPTITRNVGLMVFFSLDKVIFLLLYKLFMRKTKRVAFLFRRSGKKWIILSSLISLVGVPFLLIFMPETKNRSIFEVEEFAIFSSRKKGGQNAEENELE